MGCYVSSPSWAKPTDENDESTATLSDFDEDDESTGKLGDVLSGRLAAVDIDSVEAVRETRERR
jgi:hypothetical protein